MSSSQFSAIVAAVADEMRQRPDTAAATIAVTILDLQRSLAEHTLGVQAMEERLRVKRIIAAGIGLHFDAERIEEIRADLVAFLNELVATLNLAIETDLSPADAARALSARAANHPSGVLS